MVIFPFFRIKQQKQAAAEIIAIKALCLLADQFAGSNGLKWVKSSDRAGSGADLISLHCTTMFIFKSKGKINFDCHYRVQSTSHLRNQAFPKVQTRLKILKFSRSFEIRNWKKGFSMLVPFFSSIMSWQQRNFRSDSMGRATLSVKPS